MSAGGVGVGGRAGGVSRAVGVGGVEVGRSGARGPDDLGQGELGVLRRGSAVCVGWDGGGGEVGERRPVVLGGVADGMA